ncbi:MAG: FG-GAP-like repeat-containing protein [Singulisphaera sp.]
MQDLAARAPDRRAALRELWLLDADPTWVEAVRDGLARAAATIGRRPRLARPGQPGDPHGPARGRATAPRRLPGAARDPVVWRARLDLARGAGLTAGVLDAASHLPEDRLPAAEVLALRAGWPPGSATGTQAPGPSKGWSPSRRGSRGGWIASPCWPRRRATWNGPPRSPTQGRDRSGRGRYAHLLTAPPPADAPESLARLAETLGRTAEARGWWELVGLRDRGRPDVLQALDRLGRPRAIRARPTRRMLADQLADLAPDRPTDRPAAGREGTVPTFEDDAERAGLIFLHEDGATPLRQLPETMSGGVGLLDYDGDERLDVFFVQGGPFPPEPSPSAGDRLFRNLGDGTFADVTEAAGLGVGRGYGHGVAIEDIDNDGRPDLFVTRWRVCSLPQSGRRDIRGGDRDVGTGR